MRPEDVDAALAALENAYPSIVDLVMRVVDGPLVRGMLWLVGPQLQQLMGLPKC